VIMTSVSGHLTATKFDDEYEQNWEYPPPDVLFDVPIRIKVEDVCVILGKDDGLIADGTL